MVPSRLRKRMAPDRRLGGCCSKALVLAGDDPQPTANRCVSSVPPPDPRPPTGEYSRSCSQLSPWFQVVVLEGFKNRNGADSGVRVRLTKEVVRGTESSKKRSPHCSQPAEPETVVVGNRFAPVLLSHSHFSRQGAEPKHKLPALRYFNAGSFVFIAIDDRKFVSPRRRIS
ncbi:MAG: hypothetical protein JWR69_2876 [Pedosphaera sp.]|nr:hypothetical protein [Pedosphaera sp.]